MPVRFSPCSRGNYFSEKKKKKQKEAEKEMIKLVCKEYIWCHHRLCNTFSLLLLIFIITPRHSLSFFWNLSTSIFSFYRNGQRIRLRDTTRYYVKNIYGILYCVLFCTLIFFSFCNCKYKLNISIRFLHHLQQLCTHRLCQWVWNMQWSEQSICQ